MVSDIIDDFPEKSDLIDVSEKNLDDKITATESMVQDFQHRLKGYKKTGRGDKWDESNAIPLCGSELMDVLCGLLESFTNRVMLLVSKQKYDRSVDELQNTLEAIDYLCLRAEIGVKEYKIVIQYFVNSLSNILDVTTSSREYMKDRFRHPDAQIEDKGMGNY